MSIRAVDGADFDVSSLKFDYSRDDLDASFSAGPTRWSDTSEKPPTIAERKKSVSGRAERKWIDPTKLTDSTPQSARRKISAVDLQKAATAATDLAQAMAQVNEQ